MRSAHTPVALTTFAARIGKRSPAVAVAHEHPRGAPVLLDELDDLQPVRAHGAEALGLAEHREHEADVVGLAVVEEVAGAGLAAGERGHQLDDLLAVDRPVAVGAPVVLDRRPFGARAPRRRSGSRRHRRRTCSGRRRARRSGRSPSKAGTTSWQRAHEVRRERDHELALEQRLAHEPEVELLEVAQPAVDELARAARGARRRSRRARPARRCSRAWRRRARPRRR